MSRSRASQDHSRAKLPPAPATLAILVVFMLTGASSAFAQSDRAQFVVSAVAGVGPALGARVDISAVEDGPNTGPAVVIRLVIRHPHHVVSLAPGRYELRAELAGHHTAAVGVEGEAGARHDVHIAFAPSGSVVSTRITSVRGQATAHQMTIPSARVEGLPGARTVWALADLVHPFLVSDRTDAGGITGADPVRASGYGASWTQVTYRFGDVDVTEPGAGGLPLVFPMLDGLDAVVIAGAARGVESTGTGPVITLVPRRAPNRWHGAVGGALTPRAWQQNGGGVAPEVTRADSWSDVTATAGGRLLAPDTRLGLFSSARLLRARWTDRDDPLVLASDTRALTTRLTAGRDDGDTGVTLLVNDDTRPYRARARFADRDQREHNRAVIAGLTWRGAGGWELGGGYQGWSVDPAVEASSAGGVIERLRDGPPRQLLDVGAVHGRRVDTRASFAGSPVRRWGLLHDLTAGASVSRAHVDIDALSQPRFAELVDGRPARAWDARRDASARVGTTLGMYLSDAMTVAERLTVRVGGRVDVDRAHARGATGEVRWHTVSPRIDTRWRPRADGTLTVLGAYGRYAHRLTLDALAIGDPGAASGVMYRWNDANGDRQPASDELTAVAALGSTRDVVDRGLRRPTTREFVIGVEQALGQWRWRITGVDRRDTGQLVVDEAGLTMSDFDVHLIPDPGVDLAAPVDVPSLPVASRRASSFMRDVSVLTNLGGPPARYQGAEIDLDGRIGPLRVVFGGMTHRAEAPGASRGYRADENDPGLLGEVGLDPNAALHGRGRLFFDRAYVIKVAADYQAPRGLRMGAAARYQDGQPFTRVVVARGLGQGTDLIPAYPRGGQRFTYALTLDGRVQKRFEVGRRQVDLIGEVFNLLDLEHEVEEDIVTGPAFRTVTAVQPPRAFRLGLRLVF